MTTLELGSGGSCRLPSSVLAGLLAGLPGYHDGEATSFKASAELGRGRQDKIQCHTAHFAAEIQLLFLNKCFLDYCKPLVNFQSYEEVDSDHFVQGPSLHHTGRHLQDPHE